MTSDSDIPEADAAEPDASPQAAAPDAAAPEPPAADEAREGPATPPGRPSDEARTVFMPGPTAFAPAPSAPPPPEPPPAPPPPPAAPTLAPASAAMAAPGQGRVEVGSILNHIYEVKRFIARGGMGEVFEGANVNSDERVAIKVMLPQLAADPNVQGMFRKEAATLTRLSHPAVVQYRLLAQEPQLGVLYIVTEYIDGAQLSDLFGQLTPNEADLRLLLRRLAEGLRAAHELGAVHRDMSPDNVLLPEGRLDRAKIIDFGIAKDLDPSKGTIVGDGFAGKLGYVAPEQFGDFDRQIGPWTDVYSVGLVILAAASGKNVDMGATLVEAVDKRRAGPDLSPIPPGLRPVLERMLVADPAGRMRSMDEVLAALDHGVPATAGGAAGPPGAGPTPSIKTAPAKPAGTRPPTDGAKKSLPIPLLAGGGVAAAAVIGLVIFLALPKHPKTAAPAAPAAAAAGSEPRAEVARRAIETALPGVTCTWLDLTRAADQGSGVSLGLAGVAGSTASAQSAVVKAAGGAGVQVSDVNLEEVAPVQSSVCAPLDVLRSIRASTSETGRRLATAQRTFEMSRQPNGTVSGQALIDMKLNDPSLDFALFGLEPTGAIDAIIPGRADFDRMKKDPTYSQQIADLGGDRYRLSIGTDHQGWSGMLLLTGKGPFDPALVAAPAAKRGADWSDRFRKAAAAGGWKAEMVWYRTVDEQAN